MKLAKPYGLSFVAKMLRLGGLPEPNKRYSAVRFKAWGQLVCPHKRLTSSHKTDGVTLGWDATPAVVHVWVKQCDDCGAVFEHSGILPRLACGTPRDKHDWPLNEDGTRMHNHHAGKRETK